MHGARHDPMWLVPVIITAFPSGPDPGPIACFAEATRTTGLAQADAKQLCLGAVDMSPSRCFVDAMNTGALTMAQAQQLCFGATSDAPVECTERLEERSGLVTGAIVDYCAALHWPLIPPPNGGSADCIDAAQATGVSDTQAVQVCQGSQSTEPARCIVHGRVYGLVDSDLVELCATLVPYPIYGTGSTQSGSTTVYGVGRY